MGNVLEKVHSIVSTQVLGSSDFDPLPVPDLGVGGLRVGSRSFFSFHLNLYTRVFRQRRISGIGV